MEKRIKRNISLFLTGKLTAALGSSIYGFAIGLYILAETGSSLNFAITLLLTVLPRVLLAPIAGTLSDRWERKKIIIISDFACAVWLFAIFITFSFFVQEIWVLYLATAVLNTLNTFYSTAVTSAIHNMVGSDYLQKAMSLNQAAVSISTILGPVLGGVLFGFLNISVFMILNIIAFTISGLASIFISYDLFAEKGRGEVKTSVLTELKSGISYVRNNDFLKGLIMLSVFLNFWFAIFPVVMPYLVLTVRGMEPFKLGIIEGAFSVGMLVMSIILAQRQEVKNKERSILGGLTGMGVVLMAIGIPSIPIFMGLSNFVYFPFFIALVILLASFIMIVNMPIMILLQKSTPDEYRGRVMSLLETGASAMTPLGFILFGFILELVPAWIILAISGTSILLLVFYTIKEQSLIQHLRNIEPAKETVFES